MASITITLQVPDSTLLAKAVALKGEITIERVVLVGRGAVEGEVVHFHQVLDGDVIASVA